MLLLLESQNEKGKDGKELRIYHLDSKGLRATRSSFVAVLIEVADFYINIPTRSMYLKVLSFY